jgi:hypothetical protein
MSLLWSETAERPRHRVWRPAQRIAPRNRRGFTLTGIDLMLTPPVSDADAPSWFRWLLVLAVGFVGGAMGWILSRVIDGALTIAARYWR